MTKGLHTIIVQPSIPFPSKVTSVSIIDPIDTCQLTWYPSVRSHCFHADLVPLSWFPQTTRKWSNMITLDGMWWDNHQIIMYFLLGIFATPTHDIQKNHKFWIFRDTPLYGIYGLYGHTVYCSYLSPIPQVQLGWRCMLQINNHFARLCLIILIPSISRRSYFIFEGKSSGRYLP